MRYNPIYRLGQLVTAPFRDGPVFDDYMLDKPPDSAELARRQHNLNNLDIVRRINTSTPEATISVSDAKTYSEWNGGRNALVGALGVVATGTAALGEYVAHRPDPRGDVRIEHLDSNPRVTARRAEPIPWDQRFMVHPDIMVEEEKIMPPPRYQPNPEPYYGDNGYGGLDGLDRAFTRSRTQSIRIPDADISRDFIPRSDSPGISQPQVGIDIGLGDHHGSREQYQPLSNFARQLHANHSRPK